MSPVVPIPSSPIVNLNAVLPGGGVGAGVNVGPGVGVGPEVTVGLIVPVGVVVGVGVAFGLTHFPLTQLRLESEHVVEAPVQE